jgi:hypothetical protein
MFARPLIKALARTVPRLSTRLDAARFRLSEPATRRAADPKVQQALDAMHADGFIMLPDYWPRERCKAAIADFERIVRDRPEVVRRYSDVRVFGAEVLSDTIMEFHRDAFAQAVSDHHYGRRTINAFTLANRVDSTAPSKGSGEGWHKDLLFKQFKAFLYLNDVGPDCGPLQLMSPSHRLGDYLADMRAGGLQFREGRIGDDQMERIVARDPTRLKTLTASAGTLILADTAAIHRGCPPAGGTRYALTNYYMLPEWIDQSTVDEYRPVDGAGLLAKVAG